MAENALRILLVDDNPDDIEIGTRLLEREFPGVQIERANAPQQLQNALEAGRFNLVITDYQLQWSDGLAVLRAAKERHPHRPVIMFTGTGTQEVAVEAMKSGLDDYIIKSPKHYIRLLSSVRVALQRTEAERRAADLQMRLETLLSRINIGVFRAAQDGTMLECNAAFLRLLHTDSLEEAQQIFARDFSGGMLVDKSPLDKSVMSPAREVRVQFPDEERWFLVEVVPATTPGGQPVLDGLVEDITERKRHEEERERALAREQVLRTEAERLLRLKDEFLSVLSHELRTPLHSILGWAHLLLNRNRNDKNLAHPLETILRNVRAQAEIIDDLMDMSAIITGKLRLELQELDASESLRGALESILPTAEARNIKIEYVPPSSPAFVKADPTRLQQIVWNLLSNAIKFTDPGGSVRLQLQQEGRQILIRVSDTGRGITPEFLPYLFDRFSQADASTTRAHGGLGLGLALVRHLTELQGGSVEAASEGEGRGATFIVRLPAAVPSAGNHGAAYASPLHSRILAGKKVLLADDDPDACQLLQLMLDQYGAQVTCASSGQEALLALEQEIPDVLVFDIAMPGQDGYALLAAARARGIRTPAIALTAYARTQDRMRALAAGFQLHIPKPVEPEELTIAVANLCGRLAQEGR